MLVKGEREHASIRHLRQPVISEDAQPLIELINGACETLIVQRVGLGEYVFQAKPTREGTAIVRASSLRSNSTLISRLQVLAPQDMDWESSLLTCLNRHVFAGEHAEFHFLLRDAFGNTVKRHPATATDIRFRLRYLAKEEEKTTTTATPSADRDATAGIMPPPVPLRTRLRRGCRDGVLPRTQQECRVPRTTGSIGVAASRRRSNGSGGGAVHYSSLIAETDTKTQARAGVRLRWAASRADLVPSTATSVAVKTKRVMGIGASFAQDGHSIGHRGDCHVRRTSSNRRGNLPWFDLLGTHRWPATT